MSIGTRLQTVQQPRIILRPNEHVKVRKIIPKRLPVSMEKQRKEVLVRGESTLLTNEPISVRIEHDENEAGQAALTTIDFLARNQQEASRFRNGHRPLNQINGVLPQAVDAASRAKTGQNFARPKIATLLHRRALESRQELRGSFWNPATNTDASFKKAGRT
jgi:hypothetical protein